MAPRTVSAAVLLAGGRASRVGGSAKPLFDVGGKTLLEHAREAVAASAPVVIVGDDTAMIADAIWTREEPSYGGPAAAVVAGMHALGTQPLPEWTFLLACDLPGAVAATARLAALLPALPSDVDGVCLGDGDRPQWLIGAYRTAVLQRCTDAAPRGGAHLSMAMLLASARLRVVAAPEHETADVDTWDDLSRARDRATRHTDTDAAASADEETT